MFAHAFNHSTHEAEAGGSLEFKASLDTYKVPRQPGLNGETPSQGEEEKKAGQQGFEQRLVTKMILPLYSACLDMTLCMPLSGFPPPGEA